MGIVRDGCARMHCPCVWSHRSEGLEGVVCCEVGANRSRLGCPWAGTASGGLTGCVGLGWVGGSARTISTWWW